MGITYKQAWIMRVIRLLKVDISTDRLLRDYLKGMTGHGLACLSNAIEETSQPPVQVDACSCDKLEDGADGCPHWKAWGKCKKCAA